MRVYVCFCEGSNEIFLRRGGFFQDCPNDMQLKTCTSRVEFSEVAYGLADGRDSLSQPWDGVKNCANQSSTYTGGEWSQSTRSNSGAKPYVQDLTLH